jgi:hypothetical protein
MSKSLQTSAIAYKCLQMPTKAYKYQQIPTNTNKYQQIPTNTNKYQQIPTNTNKYQQIPANTNKYQQIPTNVYKCLQMSTNVYNCLQMSTNVYSSEAWFRSTLNLFVRQILVQSFDMGMGSFMRKWTPIFKMARSGEKFWTEIQIEQGMYLNKVINEKHYKSLSSI